MSSTSNSSTPHKLGELIHIRIPDTIDYLIQQRGMIPSDARQVIKAAVETVNSPIDYQYEATYLVYDEVIEEKNLDVFRHLSLFFFDTLSRCNERMTLRSDFYGWDVVHQTRRSVSVRSVLREPVPF